MSKLALSQLSARTKCVSNVGGGSRSCTRAVAHVYIAHAMARLDAPAVPLTRACCSQCRRSQKRHQLCISRACQTRGVVLQHSKGRPVALAAHYGTCRRCTTTSPACTKVYPPPAGAVTRRRAELVFKKCQVPWYKTGQKLYILRIPTNLFKQLSAINTPES